MADPVLFRHPASLQHDTGMHPERAERIVAIERELAAHDWLGWRVQESPAATRELLHAVHPESHVAMIEALSARGGGPIDMDTVTSSGSFEAALRAAGGAAAMVDALMTGSAPAGASAHRPPGHHATADRAMGFCLFNSVAVAARHALDAHGAERVLIFDWDVHHGNGTNDIFRPTDEVLFVSVHESPLYPGTGPARDHGSGRGEGYTVNVPVPGGSGDETWCSLAEHVVVPLARSYAPALILVSAGFDAHEGDPLADCAVTDDGFAAMAGSVSRVAAELGVPVGLVLEGGYEGEALARSFRIALEVIGAPAPPAARDLAVHPLAAETLDRLSARWPALV
jgi:acetoin utilization deacetylase AcuC-like enzyme